MSWWSRRAESDVAVAPSLLAADFTRLSGEIEAMERAGADLLHLDVMDGHFVPNLTFGPMIAAAVRRCTSLPLDAHLMVTRPERLLEAFAQAGVDAVTMHVEVPTDLTEMFSALKRLKIKRGLSLRPGTSLSRITPYLEQIDLILVMSVEPGFGGQDFQEGALQRISELVDLRRDNDYRYAISVDGGIDASTATPCRLAGADILVSGTFLFHAADRASAVRALRGGAHPARQERPG